MERSSVIEFRRLSENLLIFAAALLFAALCIPRAAFAEDITARAAIVIDSETEKILYAKNPNWKLPPASTTKLVTAMVVLDRINSESAVVISDNAASTPSVTPKLRAGERFTVRELLHLALMRSVNSAAVALAEAVAGSEDKFVLMMNEKAAAIGAENTLFANASGLPGPGQYITVFDLTKIMKESLKYPVMKEILNTRTKEVFSENGRRMFVKNTNQLLWGDDDLLGGKTGYTRAAGHCFVCAAQRGENTLITAVLGANVRDELWLDSSALLVRGHDVITHKSEPMIYLSRSDESPVVFASYKAKKKNRSMKYKKVKKLKNKDKIKTVEKKFKKKKRSNAGVAKKGKRNTGKNMSANRPPSLDKS